MKALLNFAYFPGCLEACGGIEALESYLTERGLDGVELVWGGGAPEKEFPQALCVGYHLTFYPDWLDFWRGDQAALLKKFGSRAAYEAFYGGADQAAMLACFRRDFARAAALGAEYVVIHASDVSLEEGFTYRWLHSDRSVLDAAAELINLLLDGKEAPFAVLVENQWWPGLTLRQRAPAEALLASIACKNKGFVLDTGHLLHTNPALRDEKAAVRYIHETLDVLGPLAGQIRAIHLHKSLSGAYVREHTGFLPQDLAADYLGRFGQSYAHIQRIDRHEPWTVPEIGTVIRRIGPQWLTHELAAPDFRQKCRALEMQQDTLRKGGMQLAGE